MTIITCEGYADEKTWDVDGWHISAFMPTKGLLDPWAFKYSPEIVEGEIGFTAKARAGKRFVNRIFEVELLVDRKIYEQDDALVCMIWSWAMSKLLRSPICKMDHAVPLAWNVSSYASNEEA